MRSSHGAGTTIISGALTAGKTIEIDGVRRYAAVGGIDAMPRLAIESDWPMVIPGQNIVTANTAATGNVRFSERWI